MVRGEFFGSFAFGIVFGLGIGTGVTSGEPVRSNPMLGNGATGLLSCLTGRLEFGFDPPKVWKGGAVAGTGTGTGVGTVALVILGELKSIAIGAMGAIGAVGATLCS